MAERKERPGVLLYYETFDSLEEYTDEETGQFLRAACDYARFGLLPEFTDRGLRSLWKRTMHDLDRDEAKYQATCQQNRYNAYVSAIKRRFRIDHPGMGDPKEGKDYFTFEDWVSQIDEATASDRIQSQATVTETEPTRTPERTPTASPAPATSSARPEFGNTAKPKSEDTAGAGERCRGEAASAEDLQVAWKAAKTAGDYDEAYNISNALFRMGYNLDHITGELSKR